jgi:transcriptional regulator with XRE-family HTH domain
MPTSSGRALAERIRSILVSRGLSLADVSRASRSLGPGNHLCYVPHNFYSSLRNPRFSPSLYHLFALSTVSGYRLVDWLAVFGFSLDDAPRFQVALPTARTVELDTNVYQPRSAIPWFYDLMEADLSMAVVPLSQWLAPGPPRRYDSRFNEANRAYRYVKIGSQDAFAFPDLLPGSIVRVSHRSTAINPKTKTRTAARRLFLVEHSNGLTCCRLHRSETKRIVLCSRQLPYAPVELQEGSEAVVLGIAEFEIRPVIRTDKPVVPPRLGRYWTPSPLPKPSPVGSVGEFIRRARQRSGLSFRAASRRTGWIARELGDSRYYCSPGALSDYETRKFLPRHIHKLISISAVYFGSAAEFLATAAAGLDTAGKLPMPDRLVGISLGAAGSSPRTSHFLGEMERRFKRLPYFLHRALSTLFGLPDFSVRDVFWAGGTRGSIHSYSAGALFLVIDRKQKIPRPALSSPVWAQPAYILLRRDGSYLWGFCALQNRTLIVRGCTAGSPKLQRLRDRVDAEVVGRVVGIVRTLKSGSRADKKS